MLSVVFADNSVIHMLSGKAVARAVRGRMLVDAALNIMLAAKSYGVDICNVENTGGDSDEIEIHNELDIYSVFHQGNELSNNMELQEMN